MQKNILSYIILERDSATKKKNSPFAYTQINILPNDSVRPDENEIGLRVVRMDRPMLDHQLLYFLHFD
jgi:hypothetical protein